MKKKNKTIELEPGVPEIIECQVKMNHVEKATHDLYEAIADNDFDAAEKAINDGADINASNQPCAVGGGSPLDSASFWSSSYDCSTKMIEFLRLHGATNYNLERVKYLDEAMRCRTADVIQQKRYLHKKRFKKIK